MDFLNYFRNGELTKQQKKEMYLACKVVFFFFPDQTVVDKDFICPLNESFSVLSQFLKINLE